MTRHRLAIARGKTTTERRCVPAPGFRADRRSVGEMRIKGELTLMCVGSFQGQIFHEGGGSGRRVEEETVDHWFHFGGQSGEVGGVLPDFRT